MYSKGEELAECIPGATAQASDGARAPDEKAEAVAGPEQEEDKERVLWRRLAELTAERRVKELRAALEKAEWERVTVTEAAADQDGDVKPAKPRKNKSKSM